MAAAAEGRGFGPFSLKETPVLLQGSESSTLNEKQNSVSQLWGLQNTLSHLSEGKRDPKIWIMAWDILR